MFWQTQLWEAMTPDSTNFLLDWLFVLNCLLDSREFNNASIHSIELNIKEKHEACVLCIRVSVPIQKIDSKFTQLPNRQLNYASELSSSLWLQCLFVVSFFSSKVTRYTWHCSNGRKRSNAIHFIDSLNGQFLIHIYEINSCALSALTRIFDSIISRVYECRFPVSPCANWKCVYLCMCWPSLFIEREN